jgi:hypothetical protein
MSTTPEDRMFAFWKANRRNRYWWNGDSYGHTIYMQMARMWKRPIREIKEIIEVKRDGGA